MPCLVAATLLFHAYADFATARLRHFAAAAYFDVSRYVSMPFRYAIFFRCFDFALIHDARCR